MGSQRMTAVVIIEAVVIILLVILVAGLLRSHAEILRQLDRLGAGESSASVDLASPRPKVTDLDIAPMLTIEGETPAGSHRTINLAGGRNPTLVAFLSTGCASCQAFWSSMSTGQPLPLPDARIVIVTKGSDGESPSKVRGLAPIGVDVLMSSEVWDSFKVPMTPHFMLLDSDGRVVGEGSALNWEQLTGMLEQSVADMDDPRHMGTAERAGFTDTRLAQAGVEPGDPSLYENPREP